MKEEPTDAVEYLKEFGVCEVNGTVYSKGPITMECIQLTEEVFARSTINWKQSGQNSQKSSIMLSNRFQIDVSVKFLPLIFVNILRSLILVACSLIYISYGNNQQNFHLLLQ
ncbi:unnamed protein product [Lepeophtheirus salmonis]|uniref:(salmon louse) hypothetical protein n=1 Tax=Lepeophtheirus salmonis TaxID=72036 RepID=A0A817FFC1_LEPSM|nr:unnamed protein product [Lepeophtheirus salmonis]